MAATKTKTATARVHNWTPAKGAPRKAANKKRGAKKHASKGRKKGKKRNPGPGTALATPKVVEIIKYRNRKNGTPAKRSNGTKAKRNPSANGSALSQFRLKGNPSFEGATNVAKIAVIGFGGGLLARTNSAVALALVRRFGGTQGAQMASHPVMKPVTTALAAWFLVPRELGWMGVKSEQSKKVAQVGGILFAAADLVDVFFEGVNSLPDRLAALVGGGSGAVATNPKTAIATQAATAAAQGAADAGYSDEMIEAAARAAAQGTLAGLEGVPSVNDLAMEDLSWLV